MKATAIKINPEDYILSVLSPEDRLDAAFKISKEAFKRAKLTMKDIDKAVKSGKNRDRNLLCKLYRFGIITCYVLLCRINA